MVVFSSANVETEAPGLDLPKLSELEGTDGQPSALWSQIHLLAWLEEERLRSQVTPGHL